MNCRNIIYMSVLFILLPSWLGVFWVDILKIRGRVERFLHAWVLGFATMLASGQLVLVPLVALKQTLTNATVIWQILLTILAGAVFVWVLLRMSRCAESGQKYRAEESEKNAEPQNTRWAVGFGVIALVLILMQAYIPARYEHSDDDDSRFIAEEVSAVVHDTMYEESPITADFMYWNEGEVRKDLTSPWAMYKAMHSRLTGIPPAVLSHTYLPFFLILLCYAVYALLGRILFKGDWEKTFLFLIVLSVIHLSGYTSTHTLASMLLLRIWQGKAVVASFILPLFFYLFYRIMKTEYRKGWIPLLYVASIGACLLSGIGIVTAPVMLFLYGILDFCYYRKWRKTFAIWMAAVPCGIYLVYYLI